MEAKITFSRLLNCVVGPLGEKPCAWTQLGPGGGVTVTSSSPAHSPRVACGGQAGCVSAHCHQAGAPPRTRCKASEAEQEPSRSPELFVGRRVLPSGVYLCGSWSEREGLQLGPKQIPGLLPLHQG